MVQQNFLLRLLAKYPDFQSKLVVVYDQFLNGRDGNSLKLIEQSIFRIIPEDQPMRFEQFGQYG